MSIFSKIKSSKKAAEEHKAQQAAKQAEEVEKPAPAPYRHVPKHAAQDALVGTPGAADKHAIIEANKQRTLYSRNTFYSSSSPSLKSAPGTPIQGHSRSSSRVRPALQDRRSHPGYASYQNSGMSVEERRSRANSRHGKSPLSSVPITPVEHTPRDSSASSSAASSFSSRSYTDPIQPSVPFSERLQTITSNRSVRSVKTNATTRTPLYTPRTEVSKPKPWEVAAAKSAKKPETVAVQEVTKPKPAVIKTRFLGLGKKQVAVAAC